MEISEAKREAYCRSCNKTIAVGEKMLRQRTRNDVCLLCIDCCKKVGELAKPHLFRRQALGEAPIEKRGDYLEC